jgi:hypothetical protein
MALTASTHKIAQSISGQTFVVYSDGGNVIQATLSLPGTFTYLTASSTGQMDTASILHRLTLNQAVTNPITIADASGTVAIIAAGTLAGTLTYECAVTGPLTVTCGAAPEDLTVVWA